MTLQQKERAGVRQHDCSQRRNIYIPGSVLRAGDYVEIRAHLQSSVFKLSKDLIDSIHEEGIVAYTS